jgi:hypothetical protein
MRIGRFEDIEAWELAIHGFIKYLLAYDQGQRKKGNPEQ